MEEVNDFGKAKVGDKVYSLLYGEGTILQIDDLDLDYPVEVDFYNENKDAFLKEYYLADGRLNYDTLYPDLYRTQPTVTAPPPKKKVKIKTYVVFFKAPLNGNPEIASVSFDKEDKYAEFISRPYLQVIATEIIEKEF